MEAQLQFGDLYFLFLTTANHYEDSLTIIAINNEMKIIDSAFIGYHTCTDDFKNLKITGTDTLEFSFMGDFIFKAFSSPVKLYRNANKYYHLNFENESKSFLETFRKKHKRFGYFSIEYK